MLDLAQAHNHDSIGKRHCFFLVVGDVNEGAPQLCVQAIAFGPQFTAQLGVEAGQRLIEQKYRRVRHQRSRQRNALGFPSRALVRHLIEQMADAHHLGNLAHPLDPLRPRYVLHAQAELDVLRHRLMRKQRVALEHHAEAAVTRLEIVDDAPVNADFAGGRIFEAGDHPQGRGLAAPRRPDKDDEFTVCNGAGQVLHRRNRAERLTQVHQLDRGHGYLRTMPKLKPRTRCLRINSPTIINGMVIPTARAACRP